MRYRFGFVLAAALVALGFAPATASPAAAHLESLARDMTFDWAKTHPLFATSVGITDEDGELVMPSEAGRARDLATVRGWRARLERISLAGATLAERDDALLLRAQLVTRERAITVYKTDEKDYSAAANAIVNTLFTQFQHLPVPEQGGATSADLALAWDRLLSRLGKAPQYIAAGEKLARHPGRLFGTFGAEQLAGAPEFFNGPLTDAAKAQLSPERFGAFVAARDGTLAAMARSQHYIEAHVKSWPENFAIGKSNYIAMLRDEQLLDFTPRDIERMGQDELAHGWAEQVWLESVATQRGTRLGPATGGGMAPVGKALVPYYRERIAQLTNFLNEHDIVTVPAWLGDVQVVETPAFLQPVQPGASMDAPRLFSKDLTAFYYITPPKSFEEAAKRLDLYVDFDRDRILSTGGHEALPGHFLQLSIARRHSDFVRRIQNSGTFAEGWAYYSEEMLVRVGLYGDSLDGRLNVAQWERIRGVRAIADTKLATGEWTFERATAFFAAQTGATPEQARAGAAAIALSPGDTISYTVGRFQLESLLGEYRRRTGGKGSLHDFHDRLLSYGTTPFAIVAPELLADLDKPAAAVRAAANF